MLWIELFLLVAAVIVSYGVGYYNGELSSDKAWAKAMTKALGRVDPELSAKVVCARFETAKYSEVKDAATRIFRGKK